MIQDLLENADAYAGLPSAFATAFAWIREHAATAPLGKHPVDGDTVFAIVEEYETRPSDSVQFEAHRLRADIQTVLSGEEEIAVMPKVHLKTSTPYEPTRDIEFFQDAPHSAPSTIRMRLGEFAIFLPQDAHKPGCALKTGSGKVRKVVMKILLPNA
jgi:YhcH/YjgK/YiaL family protein